MNSPTYYFVKSLRRLEDTITGRLGFRPEHAIFKGHFPGQPVVPGVCMLDIVKTVLQEQLGQPLMLTAASRVKFLQALIPDADQLVDLEIRYVQQPEGLFDVFAQFLKQDQSLFKFQGRFILAATSAAGDLVNK